MRNIFHIPPCIAPRLWGCSCQLEEDQITQRIYDSEAAENRITIPIDRGECTGIQSSPAWSDYFKCSTEVVSSMGAVCIINRALALIHYNFQLGKASLFLLLVFPPNCQVSQSHAILAVPPCRFAYLQNDIYPLSRETKWEFAPEFLQCHISGVGFFFSH